MAYIKFFKVTSMPATPEPNAFYYVENGDFAESYLTDAGGVPKAVGNSAMVNSLIADALADFAADLESVNIVDDIAARDALIATLTRDAMILVIDATGDPTVAAGSALYAYSYLTTTTYKIAEYESMDVIVQWSSISGRPVSTPAQIDSAVSQAHSHSNKAQLDKIGEGGDGGMTYNGLPVSTAWTQTDW